MMKPAQMKPKRELKECNVLVTMNTFNTFWRERLDAKQMEHNAQEVIKGINRHIDKDNVQSVQVQKEYSELCEFCGYAWSPDPATGCNGCCDQHIDAWRAEILAMHPGYKLNVDEDGLVPDDGLVAA